MPWRNPALPANVRDAVYDAYSQGVRHRVSGWTAERVRTEGLHKILVLSAYNVGWEYHAVIEQAFWDGFTGPASAMRA